MSNSLRLTLHETEEIIRMVQAVSPYQKEVRTYRLPGRKRIVVTSEPTTHDIYVTICQEDEAA